MFRARGETELQLASSPHHLTRTKAYTLIANRVLKYVKNAIAETDVPEALPEFISQRRRWLNGSFFAATYAIAHLGQILQSGHSLVRKVLLVFETIYNVINLIAAWFAVVRRNVVLSVCDRPRSRYWC